MKKPKHIGIVAVSAEGAALCYLTICVEGAAVLGSHSHPEITMHNYPLADHMRFIVENRWVEVGDLVLQSAAKLRAAGADFLICPDNTEHQAIDLVRERSPLPWLHIAEEVATVAASRGFKKVLLLGTRYLMEGPVYPPKLEAKGISRVIPDAKTRERINEIIFDELVYGKFEKPARSYFVEVIEKYKAQGCEAVILGCTEIPLLITDKDSPIPTLDSTRILARAALREATASRQATKDISK
jgi:aspartate racemase